MLCVIMLTGVCLSVYISSFGQNTPTFPLQLSATHLDY